MSAKFHPLLRLILVLIAVTALVAGSGAHSEANAGPPYYSQGEIAAEPSGISTVAIDRESLVIDMSKLSSAPRKVYSAAEADAAAGHNPISVTSTYTLTNPGPDVTVDLVFVSGAPDTSGFEVALNGEPVSARPAGEIPVPAEWQPPATTPGLPEVADGGRVITGNDLLYLEPDESARPHVPYINWRRYPIEVTRETVSSYAFNVTIPSGQSTLSVTYNAEPQQYRTGGYTDRLESYQFAYILAPARAWADFGGLDVTVRLSSGWRAASRPGLERVGDELRGSFSELPADALALTVAPLAPVIRCAGRRWWRSWWCWAYSSRGAGWRRNGLQIAGSQWVQEA
jgi:hypothetical protein